MKSKILIVEDNHDVRENLSEILTLSGYQTITAANGKQGVEKALAEIPDLILCDIIAYPVQKSPDGACSIHFPVCKNRTR